MEEMIRTLFLLLSYSITLQNDKCPLRHVLDNFAKCSLAILQGLLSLGLRLIL